MDIKRHIKAQLDFKFFCKEVLGYRRDDDIGYYDLTPKHDEIMETLQSSRRKSKLILTPRESIKSQIYNIGYILWRMARNPDLRILIYSDSISKAQGFLYGVKTHIEGKAPNSIFRDMYPKWETDPHKGGVYNESRIVISARNHAQKEPSVDTAGIEQSKVGMHYDIIIFDDIVSDVNTTTKVQMDKVHDCYKKALSLLKRGGEVVMIGTRWHFGDCYARIIEDNQESEDFELIVIDAEDEIDGKLVFEGKGS